MNFRPGNPNLHDAHGFKDEENEAFHEMHETRMQLNAKVACLGYMLLLIAVAVCGIYFYFFC
jgi:hypothetical protein